MTGKERQETVLRLLQGLQGLEPLKKLFWSELSYQRINKPLPRRGWSETAAKALAEDPILFAGGGEGDAFQVIYSRLASDRLLLGSERPVVSRLLREHPYTLFIFSNHKQDRWHFLNVKYDEKTDKRRLFRRITIGPEERLRTASERVGMLDLESINRDLFGLAPLQIQARHDQAFDVEAVTDQFFKDYQVIFKDLLKDLRRQTKDNSWAHDYTLQFLNRLMFIYFIQRKRREDGKPWLGDIEFMKQFWSTYQTAKKEKDTFFTDWICVLFFHAFNNKLGSASHLPKEIRAILQDAPYLNGGLFSKNELAYPRFDIKDKLFEPIFEFLEKYNFTISESTPLDQEVAVDPEMIGKVYESLVNVSEEADERGEAGIFYTPRTEIDLMCRLALVDHLQNRLGKNHRNLLYELVFAFEPEEKSHADDHLAKEGIWPELDNALGKLTVCDPACGSGSFLVGMLHILFDLRSRARHQLGSHQTDFAIKRLIIADSLYGVDVMDWAVHVAELRLWLSLMIETELGFHQLKLEPLLPNLSFKIRQGDSLIQELAGINLARIRESHQIPKTVKGKISRLKAEKKKYLYAEKDALKKVDLENLEVQTFREILAQREQTFQEELKKKQAVLAHRKGVSQAEMFERKAEQLRMPDPVEGEIETLKEELARVQEMKRAITQAKNVPFVWDIAFVEIFESEEEGFDIVVGNPPYVRQESIIDPNLCLESKARLSGAKLREAKVNYKTALIQSVHALYPGHFGAPTKPKKKLDAKADLYIYFFFHGLGLLNQHGSFCFITSNSWLDAGYGKDLQEFMLRRSEIKLVLDNQVKRSFLSAEVNTVITLLSAPFMDRSDKSRPDISPLQHQARFVMFKVPFEQVLSPVIFQEIMEKSERQQLEEYRINVAKQEALLEEGMEPEEPEGAVKPKRTKGQLLKTAKYIGNKWGGKYLRALDIYWIILEKGKGKLVRLGDIADVRFGIKTGANDFFYLDNEKIREWGIEKRYLRPAIKTPRDYYSIIIPGSEIKMFWCQEDRRSLKGTNALEYIKWGESKGFDNVPSCKSRNQWYSLRGPEKPIMLWPSAFFERHIVYECPKDYVADKVFYTISGNIPTSLKAYLNSSLVSLLVEAEGYQLNHGGIFVTTEWLSNLPVLGCEDDKLEKLYNKLAKREIALCADEIQRKDRKELDKRIFELLSIGHDKFLDNLYQSIQAYVSGRIHKARRGLTQKGREYDETEKED